MLAQERLGRLAAHDAIGDGVGVSLVDVAGRAHAAFEVHATPLLHHVRRLVRGRVQAGRGSGKREVIAAGKRLGGAHRLRAFGGSRVGVRLHVRDVVRAERLLDRLEMRQRPTGAADAVLRRLLDVGARLLIGVRASLRQSPLYRSRSLIDSSSGRARRRQVARKL